MGQFWDRKGTRKNTHCYIKKMRGSCPNKFLWPFPIGAVRSPIEISTVPRKKHLWRRRTREEFYRFRLAYGFCNRCEPQLVRTPRWLSVRYISECKFRRGSVSSAPCDENRITLRPNYGTCVTADGKRADALRIFDNDIYSPEVSARLDRAVWGNIKCITGY